jgi:hypothetical protein
VRTSHEPPATLAEKKRASKRKRAAESTGILF